MVDRFQREQSGCDKKSKMMVYAMNMVVLPAEMDGNGGLATFNHVMVDGKLFQQHLIW